MLAITSKIRILENFMALDFLYFGKQVSELQETECCPELLKEYVITKGALISIVKEMYEQIEHAPQSSKKVTKEKLVEMAKHSSEESKEKAKNLLATNETVREYVKTSILESAKDAKDVEEVVDQKVEKYAMALASDNLLVTKSIYESENPKYFTTWEGNILRDAYKALRDNLVELAILIRM